MIEILKTIIYEPLYNTLVYFISIAPGKSLGVAIILLTVLVKFILLPLTHKQSKSQRKMKMVEPEIKQIKETHKNDKQEQARQTMELYKKHGINPFSGCVAILVQLPVIIALYRIFFKGFEAGINTEILYSFIIVPTNINTVFLGFDLLEKSIILAFLAGATQFFQMRLAMPGSPQKTKEEKKGGLSFQEEFAKNMGTQFKYIMPGIVFFFAWSISAAVALYWTTSNIFSIVHELIVKHKAESLMVSKDKNELR